MSTRMVRVRLRRATAFALERLAAEQWIPLGRVCQRALEVHLLSGASVAWGRVPMPDGVDVPVPVPPELWSEAKRAADAADITIGQLCRLAAESYVRAHPPAVRRAS
jgi:hypothetical protein